jgi:hypothetical protein
METLPGSPVAVKRRTTRQLYQPIDIHSRAPAWPATIPALSDGEAKRAARLLWKRFYWRRMYEEQGRPVRKQHQPLTVLINPKLKYARQRSFQIEVNSAMGWRSMIHSLSHRFHHRLRPKDKPHSDSHRHLEREMIDYVVGSGWLDGKLKR